MPSAHRPYPEAIRGAWFLLPVDADTSSTKQYDVLMFGIDSSFYQFQIKNEQLKNASRGTYTFDGDFLITRTRTTETYRVDTPEKLSWQIETKKGPRQMTRTLDRPSIELSEEDLKTLRLLPIKAKASPLFDHIATPYMLTYEDRPIGILSVDRWITQETCWFGLLPFAMNIPEQTWLRVIAEAIFPSTVQVPEEFKHVELFFLDEEKLHHIDLLPER